MVPEKEGGSRFSACCRVSRVVSRAVCVSSCRFSSLRAPSLAVMDCSPSPLHRAVPPFPSVPPALLSLPHCALCVCPTACARCTAARRMRAVTVGATRRRQCTATPRRKATTTRWTRGGSGTHRGNETEAGRQQRNAGSTAEQQKTNTQEHTAQTQAAESTRGIPETRGNDRSMSHMRSGRRCVMSQSVLSLCRLLFRILPL